MSEHPAWYVYRDGENLGPFDAPSLEQSLADGTFTAADLWWDDDSSAWRPLAEHLAAQATKTSSPVAASALPGATSSPVPSESRPDALPPPRLGPLGSPKTAADLAAAWPALCALVPDIPASTTPPFVCEGCGGRFPIAQLHYARQAYLCGTCDRTGASRHTSALIESQNPLERLLLKHAPAWALILILVPFFGFKLLADMMDPYKSYPPFFPQVKQAASILERDAELKPLPWAHAIRQSLLSVAYSSAAAAFPKSTDAERDLAYIATLLCLEGLGRDTDAAEFIASHPNVEPTARTEEQVRKFYYVEARILLRAGRFDLLGNRLERIAPPPPPEPGMAPMGMARQPAFMGSPLMSGKKAYDMELADDLYTPIACDNEIVQTLYERVPRDLLVRMAADNYGLAYGAGIQPNASEGTWQIKEYERLDAESLKLVERIESWHAAHGMRLARNNGLDEGRVGRALDAALKSVTAAARSVNTQLNSRGEGGIQVALRLETSKPSDVTAVLRAITGSAFPHHVVLTDLSSSRSTYRNQVSWSLEFTFRIPEGMAATLNTARERRNAEFQPLTDSSTPVVEKRLATARLLVDELNREANSLDRRIPDGVEAGFGPADKIVELLAASSNNLTSFRLSSHSLHIRGSEAGGTAGLDGIKSRLGPIVAERGLTPESGSQRTTRDNKDFTDWWITYEARRR